MINASLVLQIINGFFSVLVICALFVFMQYIWDKRAQGYFDLRAAISLAAFFMGEALLRIPLWIARVEANMGQPAPIPTNWLVAGGSLAVIALLCIIRVFSPDSLENKPWMYSLAIAAFATLVSLYITFTHVVT